MISVIYEQNIYIYIYILYQTDTLGSQIREHNWIDAHLEEIAKNLIAKHLFYTISIATINGTPGIYFNCINSQTGLTIRDRKVWVRSRRHGVM